MIRATITYDWITVCKQTPPSKWAKREEASIMPAISGHMMVDFHNVLIAKGLPLVRSVIHMSDNNDYVNKIKHLNSYGNSIDYKGPGGLGVHPYGNRLISHFGTRALKVLRGSLA